LVDSDRIVDLKKEPDFLEQYVEMRNQYREVLLTEPVDIAETRDWVRSDGIEISGLVRGRSLLGAAVLYLGNGGEIAFFARQPNEGIGSKLLEAIESVARKQKLSEVWAWVLSDNTIARRAFMKNGYRLDAESERTHHHEARSGVILRKDIL
jgi:ribosomal protein S18 acetylase RimI-like enzyme